MLIIFFIPPSLSKKIKKTSPPYFPNSFPLEEKKEEERKGKGRKRSWGLSRGFRNFLKQLGCFLRRLSAASLSASSHFPRERVRRVALFLLSRENLWKGINSEEGCVFTVGKSWRKTRHFVPCNESKLEGGKVLFGIDRREQDRKHGFTCLFLLLFLLRFVAITRNFRFE